MGVSYLGLKAVGRIMASLINLSLYLVPLISLIIGSMSITGEKETGILEWLFSEPIRPGEYLVGKFIGLLIAVTLATFLGFGLASWIVIIAMPPEDITKYLMFILVAILLSSSSLALSLMISAVSRSKFEALGAAFLIWFTMIFIYDLLIMGLSISLNLPERTTFILAILNPVEASRILMIYFIDPMLTFLGPYGIYVARDLGETLPILLILVLLLYTKVFIAVTTLMTRRKDLIV
jgi:ABC-type transport system involved in multi-copper enzyme maturation permease subunit